MIELARTVEDWLARAQALDDEIADVIRSYDPGGARALLDVLGMMGAAQFRTVAQERGADDYPAFFARFWEDVAAGKVTLPAWAAVNRVATVLAMAHKAVALRQLVPTCEPVAEPVSTAPDPELLDATMPLFERYQALQARVDVGTADENLDAELSALLATYETVREQQHKRPNWEYAQWWCATVAGALARSAALQRHTGEALHWFCQARAEWERIGEQNQASDCLFRYAEAAFIDGADVDHAVTPILDEVGPVEARPDQRVAQTIRRATLLVRLARIYVDVGDHAEAGSRAEQAARTMEALGFVDPTGHGVESAFAEWVANDYREDSGDLPGVRTMKTFCAVVVIWIGVINVRMALSCGAVGAADTRVSYASGGELQYQLSDLVAEMGEQHRQVCELLSREAVEFGLPPLSPPPSPPPCPEADSPDGLTRELFRLRNEFEQPATSAKDLLGKVEALECRLLVARGCARSASSASVLRADVLVHLGRLDEAAEVLSQAKTWLRGTVGLADAEQRSLLVTLLGREALVQGMRGDFSRMSQACAEGIREVETDRGKVNGPYLQDSYLRNRDRLYAGGVFAAYQLAERREQQAPDRSVPGGTDASAEWELVLARSELAKARGVLGWAVADRDVSPPGAFETADTDDGAGEAAFHALSTELAGAGTATPADSDRDLPAKRRLLWERLMTARNRSARTIPIPEFTLAALRAVLTAEDVVVSYHWLSRTTLLIVTIDRDAVIADKVNLDLERADLDSLVSDVQGIDDNEAPWLDTDIPRPGPVLLPRKGRELLAGKNRLIISPHRQLHQLPFHAFKYQGAPLVEQFAVVYVPNLTSLLLPARPTRPPRLLSLGVSEFVQPHLQKRRLSNAVSEATDVARIYQDAGPCAAPLANDGVTLLVNEEATFDRIEELRKAGTLGSFTTLHLVTHGDDPPIESPFDAALYLQNEKIDGLQISQWHLPAELVVLSACHSGQRAVQVRPATPATGQQSAQHTEDLFGDEVFGLQAAFFTAGARQVLGALWPAGDTTGAGLMTTFHRQVAAGLPAEFALREAMNELRGSNAATGQWAHYKLVLLGPLTPGTGPATTSQPTPPSPPNQ